MCGRFALGLSHDEIQEMHGYNVHIGEWVGRDAFVPRYNVAPRTNAPVIRGRNAGEGNSSSSSGSSSSRPAEPSSDAHATGSEAPAPAPAPSGDSNKSKSSPESPKQTEVILQTMRWGLVPHFNKHDDGTLKTINARSEVLVEEQRGMWASIKGKKRCAVVCQGYYEWQKKGKARVPHFTKHADGRVMLLAGLWDSVVLEGQTERLWTFTIVTTEARKDMAWLHDRQPVILPDDDAVQTWLDTSSATWTPQLSKLCEACQAPLTCYAVAKEVGKIGNESPSFVQPIAERKDGIQAMFAKQAQTASRKRPAADPATSPPPKKAKANRLDDSDSDIECIPSMPNPSPSQKSSSPKRPTKPKPSPRKSHNQHPSSSAAKITSFPGK